MSHSKKDSLERETKANEFIEKNKSLWVSLLLDIYGAEKVAEMLIDAKIQHEPKSFAKEIMALEDARLIANVKIKMAMVGQ